MKPCYMIVGRYIGGQEEGEEGGQEQEIEEQEQEPGPPQGVVQTPKPSATKLKPTSSWMMYTDKAGGILNWNIF